MSGHPHTIHLPPPERFGSARAPLSAVFGLAALVGIVLSVVGACVDPKQFAFSWFFGFWYFMTLALGMFFWITLHYACAAGWDVLSRRVWENTLALFPVLLLISIPLTFPEFRDFLWRWTPNAMQTDHEVVIRNQWLNLPFFYMRGVAYFAYFILAGLYYRRESVRQDHDGNPAHTRRMHDWSYLSLVIFGVLQTFMGLDWYSGLDWRWASSLFGVYTFGVEAQGSLALGIVLVALFRAGGYLKQLNHEHFYLMGKLLFGFSIFWAYVAFGQYLLIWYANIPEETIFYNDHNRGSWVYLTYFLAAGKFLFPVFFLLSQDVKKSLKSLTALAVWILFMHGVEIYWFVAPYAHGSVYPSWQDFVSFLTIFSILAFAYVRICGWASLVAYRDPRLVESITATN